MVLYGASLVCCTICRTGSVTKAPVYFIYSNHDRQPTNEAVGGRTFSDDELESAIFTNGIKILQDEWVSFSDDLVLFGREDESRAERKPLSSIPKRPDNAFVLAVDHAP